MKMRRRNEKGDDYILMKKNEIRLMYDVTYIECLQMIFKLIFSQSDITQNRFLHLKYST